MKVIFLDIDGVLNYTEWYISDRNPGNLNGEESDLDPECINRIIKICESTNAKIVITSDWRLQYESTLNRLSRVGLPKDLVIGHTPYHQYVFGSSNKDWTTRGSEINHWLSDNIECTNYVIIDDRYDFTEDQQPHFIHIDPMYGINDDHVDIAIMTLNHH